MPTTQKIAETDEGQLDLVGNELVLRDKTGGDPVAMRLRSANGGIAKICFDRPDGHGGWVELGYIYGKIDERFADPRIEFEFWASGSTDTGAARLFAVRTDGVVNYVGGGLPPSVHDIWAPNGLGVTQMNDDGNFVTYRLERPFDKGRYKATFSSDSGVIPVNQQKWEGV